MGDVAEREQSDRHPRGPGLTTRLRAWRARLVADDRFRALAQRLPIASLLARKQAKQLFSLTSGFVQSQVLHAGLETGTLEALRHGPMTLPEIAAKTGLAIARLEPFLRAADALSIIHRGRDGYYVLGDIGAVVIGDAGVATMIRHHEDFYADLADTAALLRSAKPASRLNRIWSYAGDGRDSVAPDDAAKYSEVMASSQAMIVDEILAVHDFSRHRAVLDVGGGQGVFATAASRKWPSVRFALFDLPPVADLARKWISQSGSNALIECHGGSFLHDPLPRGFDGLTLIRVLFDHGDANVLKILTNCRAALPTGGQLIIAEPMAGRSAAERLSTAYFSLYLLAMGPGRCRSPEEIGDLLLQAGFSSWRVTRCRTPMLASLVIAKA